MARHAPHPAVFALALAAALCLFGAVVTAQDSTGQVVQGFTIVSNVTGYMYMSRDACDIEALIEPVYYGLPVNFTQINSIYRFGQNSLRPDGRTRRTLVAWTSGNHATGHPYYANGTALYNDANWIASFMDAAVVPGAAGSGTLIDVVKAMMAYHTSRLQLPLSYMLAELYAIADEIDPAGTNVTATGAPHALDEGFGVYVGDRTTCSPWAYAEESAVWFGTLANCNRSMVNENIIAQFNIAQAATLSGNVAQYEAARDTIIRNVQVSLIQNVLARAKWTQDTWRAYRTAEAVALDAGDAFYQTPDQEHYVLAQNATDAHADEYVHMLGHKADLYAVWRALGPLVHAQNPMVAQVLNNHLRVDAPISASFYAAVRYALQSLYPAWGITPEMVGTFGLTSPACPARPADV